MVNRSVLRLWLTTAIFTFTSGAALALPAIPSSLVQQAKNLSPAEQSALAAQYGIALPTRQIASPVQAAAAIEAPIVQNVLREDRAADASKTASDKMLPRFGAKLFSSDLAVYIPSDKSLAPTGYLLGPGDVLNVQVFGKDAFGALAEVDRSGQITLPRIGSIAMAGFTFEEAKRVIEKQVTDRLVGSEVFTSLGELRQISIFLAGEVQAPGSYNVSALTSISQALYLSGGITGIGSYREIQVLRGNQLVTSFDLYDLLLKGRSDDDITLQSGDTIFVPVASGIVTISGAVRRPARYDLQDGETFSDLVSIAGGFTASAFQSLSTVKRLNAGDGEPSIINLEGNSGEFILQDGDIVVAKQGSSQIRNAVTLTGNWTRPGQYQFTPGMRISDFLGDVDTDIKIGANLDVGLIVRRINSDLDIEVIAFDIIGVTEFPDSNQDLLLQEFDQVVLLPSEGVLTSGLLTPIVNKLRRQAGEERPTNSVRLTGAVKEPGEYPLIGKGGLRFQLALAGGLADGAYIKSVEIRRIAEGDESADVSLVNVDLTNEFNFELKSRDVVRVDFLPDWNPNETAQITGEVQFPGTYALRNGETIGTLIKRAGGFSSEAFPEAARFLSASTKKQQRRSAAQIIQRFEREQASRNATGVVGANPSQNDQDFASSLLESFQGRLVVDIDRIMAGDPNADVLLQDGDELLIPKLVESVTVAGEVYEPGSFRYQPEISLEDYLVLAAGVTKRARKKNIYVIEPNGAVVQVKRSKRQLFRFNQSVVGLAPGSVIVVPTDYDYEKPLVRYRGITSVVFESLASIAVFFSIANK
ncbi:SLBB domain-containing protein [Pseudomonadales bacterium]|nr:SLBB domain-containing protein [Pseudomonadales bacterium]